MPERKDYVSFWKEVDLRGISIGVPRNTFDENSASPIIASFEAALETFGSAGANIVNNANFPAVDEFK